eukprot:PhM_4_TR16963/c0_g1_i1/m.22315
MRRSFSLLSSSSSTSLRSGRTVPLTILSWNIDMYKSNSRAKLDERVQRLREVFREEEIVRDVDVVVFQESTESVARAIASDARFNWLEEAQAKTYNGYLQTFINKNSLWTGAVAWQYTCLTFELKHSQMRGDDSFVRVSNVQLDGADKNQELRARSVAYLRNVPNPDIIVGDGSFRRNDGIDGYEDAYLAAGQPYSHRFTIDTFENQFWIDNSRPFSARYSRCFFQQGRNALEIKKYAVLKRFVQTEPSLVGVSDHYAMLTTIDVGV